MSGVRGSLALSLAVLAAAELAYNPRGHAQEAPPPTAAPGSTITPVPPTAAPGSTVSPGPPQPPAPPPPQPNAPPQPSAPPPPQPYAPPPQAHAPPPQRHALPPPQYAAPPVPYGYGPIVILRADHPRARLQVMGPLKWQDICVAPCNLPVHPAGSYRIGGGSLRPSEAFSMPRQSGSVAIDARVGSKVKHGVGVGLTIGGAVSAVLGGLYLVSASRLSDTDDAYGNRREIYQSAGSLFLVVGAVLLAIGIPQAASSTSVTVR